MGHGTVLFRESLGDVLRGERIRQGLTLRELSSGARVSLGYISEIERGHKEASSELLAALCDALEVPLSSVLREVSEQVAGQEALSRAEGQLDVHRVLEAADRHEPADSAPDSAPIASLRRPGRSADLAGAAA